MLSLDAGCLGVVSLALDAHNGAVHKGTLLQRVLCDVDDAGVICAPHRELVEVGFCSSP